MHKVGFTQTYAAVKKQRVVTVLGVIGHLPGSSARQLVGLTLDKILEGEATVEQAGVLDQGRRWLTGVGLAITGELGGGGHPVIDHHQYYSRSSLCWCRFGWFVGLIRELYEEIGFWLEVDCVVIRN